MSITHDEFSQSFGAEKSICSSLQVIQLNDISREQASYFRKRRSPEQQVLCVRRACGA
jgi:hypothetical protein